MNEIIVHARDHESLYSALLSVSIAMVVVSCTVTGLRLYTRTFILHFVGLDDWTIAVAQAGAYNVYLCIYSFAHYL